MTTRETHAYSALDHLADAHAAMCADSDSDNVLGGRHRPIAFCTCSTAFIYREVRDTIREHIRMTRDNDAE